MHKRSFRLRPPGHSGARPPLWGRRRPHSGIAITLLGAEAVLIAGCGGSSTPTIDPAKIDDQLRQNLSASVGVSPRGVKVSCPSGEPIKTGNRFQCTLTAPDGSTANVQVTVTSDKVSSSTAHYHVHAVVPRSQFK